MIKTFSAAMLAVTLIAVALWGLSAIGWTHFKFWAPKYEEARREVFVETPSYVLGKRQFLTRLHHEWKVSGDPGHREALCSTARHEAATIDAKHLTQDLQEWECTR